MIVVSTRWGRTRLTATYLGTVRRLLDATIRHAREREQCGVPVGTFRAVSHRIVDMTLRLESARLLVYRAARGLAGGREEEIAPALAKLAVSGATVRLGQDAVHLRGALGLLGRAAEALLRDDLPARILSGTNEIQRSHVPRALGLGRRRGRR